MNYHARRCRKELVRIAGSTRRMGRVYMSISVGVMEQSYIDAYAGLLSTWSNPRPSVPTKLVSVPRSLRRFIGRHLTVLA